MKLNRNDNCWCGSGKKYKKCHAEFDEKYEALRKQGFLMPSRKLVKNEEQIQKIKESAKINNAVLDLVSEKIKEGMSTEDIDKIVYDYTVSQGAIPAPLNYGGFPKSVCTSINEEVCHGIPDKNIILRDGDIINVDVSTIKDGYYSDASRMFMIGNVSEEAKRLVEVSKECLQKGIEAVKPWGFLGDIGAAVQEHAEKNGYSVVRDFGGHGIGLEFHEDPFVAHVGEKGEGMVLVPGMMFTIEPMINQGDYGVFVDADNDWTAITEDGSLSSQWEHMILVTEDGIELISY
ncbi:methionyl aminopeptidase [Clostridium sp.]|uniref:methionyl aminopeptidase n=1 Tax=Clostridium sp. TaxID=1506 RepID=UPI002A91636C|nr:methionyl aminopeptidase [Clostridium sp.]MDY6012375.1 methionyl aminopeptidase [Clostridium sp.]